MSRVLPALAAALSFVAIPLAHSEPAVSGLEMDVMGANESPEHAVARLEKKRRSEDEQTARHRPPGVAPEVSTGLVDDSLATRTVAPALTLDPLAGGGTEPALLNHEVHDHVPDLKGHDDGKDKAHDKHAANDVKDPVEEARAASQEDKPKEPKAPKEPKQPKPPKDGDHKGHGH